MEDFDAEVACEKLRNMREDKSRDSSAVVELGKTLVKNYSHRFGDEFWLICEQVFIAALDVCHYDLATICLKKLEKRFPNSDRVKKLQGMDLEASGEFESALKIYSEIEKGDPTNAPIRKRRTAIFKAQGKIPDAIKSIAEYLKTFMADTEAWLELAELYTEELEFGKAAFCMEEVILAQPRNHLIHQRYAEIKYSQGGLENLITAKDHFAESVFLSNKTNMRALYGMLLTCTRLHSAKSGEKEKKSYKIYIDYLCRMIADQHREASEEGASSRLNDSSLADIDSMLKKMKLSVTT